ncbi:MAG TPA: hypothetical protein VMZ50_00130 [Phycisphaerae bacterium]|nr:hypothetical protein [Phycisphaerae bacterium]
MRWTRSILRISAVVVFLVAIASLAGCGERHQRFAYRQTHYPPRQVREQHRRDVPWYGDYRRDGDRGERERDGARDRRDRRHHDDD